VLIVDDEPSISELLFEMLLILGYAPSKCTSPLAALEVLGRQTFDVVLSDFRMPQMNGDAFFRHAVAKSADLQSRFVFLTGDTVSEETQQFLAEHGSRHLSKPFDIASVEQVISEVVAQHGAAVVG
jgi:CheY-like chemotaxis protein